jgi:nucleotide-binding universal stress UspA family protein
LFRKKQSAKHGGKKMNKVLIAADDTKGSLAVLDVFRNQVRPPQEVILVHVQRPLGRSLMANMLGEAEMSTLKEMVKETEFQEELDKQSERILSYFKEELKKDGLFKITTVIRAGNVHEEILKVAEKEQVDLMILGCTGKAGLDRMLTGSVTKDVERRATVPVIVAKSVKQTPIVESLGELQEAYNNAR